MLSSTQKLLDELTSAALENKDVLKVKMAPTPAEKVKVFLDNKSLKQTLVDHVKNFTRDGGGCQKDNMRAHELRAKGNNLYSRHWFDSALKLYSAALRHSTPGSEQMRLSYGNRSAVLFEIKEYNGCIRDVDRALNNSGEPAKDITTVRLLLRKATSYKILDKLLEASQAYRKALRVASECPPDMKNKEKFIQLKLHEAEAQMSLVDMKYMTKKEKDSSPEVTANGKESEADNILPEVSYGINPNFPSASIALQLKEGNPVRGRYVVAKQHIRKGDTLFYEKPFAFVLLPESYIAHCHQCLKAAPDPIPCLKCSEAEYCSEDCLKLSEGSYHRWECGGGLALCQSVGIAHLGLRLALVAADQNMADHYTRVKTLLTHINEMTPSDLYQYTLTASILVIYLETCTDFLEHSGGDPSLVGGDILEHIGRLVCNGHAITELQERLEEDPAGLHTEEVVRIATAIFPSASMMNHSCDPNIMNSFYNQYLVVRAAKNIRPGEEVFNCYGPHYRRMCRKERQKALREQYKFVCKCDTCCGTMMVDFDQLFSCSYLCPHCNGPLLPFNDPPTYECLHCSQPKSQDYIHHIESNILKADHFFRTGEQHLMDGEVQDAVENFQKCLQLREKALFRHNTAIRDCLDKMAKCHSLLGQYEESFNCLEKALVSIEEQFGECSSELAFELFKISDVCFKLAESAKDARPVIRKVYRYVDTAREIIDILFGKWSAKYAEIKLIQDNLLRLSVRHEKKYEKLTSKESVQSAKS